MNLPAYLNECGGPWSIQWMPVRGVIITGGEMAARYFDTPEEGIEELYKIITESGTFSSHNSERNVEMARVIIKLAGETGFRQWEEMNKEAHDDFVWTHVPLFTVIRVVGAFLCTYGLGMMVLKDAESVKIMAQDWITAKPLKERPKREEQKSSGQLTMEEVRTLFSREQGGGVWGSSDPNEG